MATEKNIVMKEFNGTDYDTLYPKTIGTQVDGIFTSEQTLTSNTKALYGLGTDAVPDDVFTIVGKYAQHWWKRRTAMPVYKYRRKSTTQSKTTYEIVANADSSASLVMNRDSVSGDGYTPKIIYYSSSITVDKETGAITLNNQSSAKFAMGYSNGWQALEGNYIRGAFEDTNGIYKITSSPSYTTKKISVYYYQYYTTSVEKITSEQYIDHYTYGEWEFVQSNSDTEYPKSGIEGGYEYVYLGRPFDNAIEVNEKAKIATGSYTGTGGDSGSSTKITLNFEFTPKLVFIQPTSASPGNPGSSGLWDNTEMLLLNGTTTYYLSGDTYYNNISWGENSVSWYLSSVSSKTSGLQLNASGVVYRYIAIG